MILLKQWELVQDMFNRHEVVMLGSKKKNLSSLK